MHHVYQKSPAKEVLEYFLMAKTYNPLMSIDNKMGELKGINTVKFYMAKWINYYV